MGRKAMPKFGIEYDFKFRNAKTTHISTLIFEGTKPNGRLEFFNKQSGTYTSMPAERFSYIHRFNLIEERAVVEKPKVNIEDKAREREEIENIKIEQRNLECFYSFTEKEKIQAKQTLGVVIEDFITIYKNGPFREKEAIIMTNIAKLFPEKPWAI